MNTHRPTVDRSDFAKLAYAPLGLLLCASALGHGVAAEPRLAAHLLALAMGLLLGWLGGEFEGLRGVVVERRRERRLRARASLTHEAA